MKKYYFGIMIIVLALLTTGCKKKIFGNWKIVNEKEEFYYVFNRDNTCSYQMKKASLSCTYQIDEEKITILFNGESEEKIYSYEIKADILTIKDKTGKENKFKKEKEIHFD